MAAISGFITAYLKIQDGGQTKELKEHRIYMNLKSYAPETFVLCDHFNHEFLYYCWSYNIVAAILIFKSFQKVRTYSSVPIPKGLNQH